MNYCTNHGSFVGSDCPVCQAHAEQAALLARATYGEQCADTNGFAAAQNMQIPWLPNQGYGVAVSNQYVQSEIVHQQMLADRDYGIDVMPYTEALELRALVAQMRCRAEQAERNLEATIAERDALRVELAQRVAMPARALKFST